MIYEITYKEKYTVINKIITTVEADSKEEALNLINKGYYDVIEDVDELSDNTEILEILNVEEVK